MKNNIVLIGMMGCGKTTVGRAVADFCNMNFIDLDELIEKNEKTKITEIFSLHGEKYFRELENKILKNNYENAVISTGGGIVECSENIKILNKLGFVFYLDVPINILYKRIKGDKKRPLLKSEKDFEKIFKRREGKYVNAGHKINANKSVNKIVEEIYEYCCKSTK